MASEWAMKKINTLFDHEGVNHREMFAEAFDAAAMEVFELTKRELYLAIKFHPSDTICEFGKLTYRDFRKRVLDKLGEEK